MLTDPVIVSQIAEIAGNQLTLYDQMRTVVGFWSKLSAEFQVMVTGVRELTALNLEFQRTIAQQSSYIDLVVHRMDQLQAQLDSKENCHHSTSSKPPVRQTAQAASEPPHPSATKKGVPAMNDEDRPPRVAIIASFKFPKAAVPVDQKEAIKKFITNVVPVAKFGLRSAKQGNLLVEFPGVNGRCHAAKLVQKRKEIADRFGLHVKYDQSLKKQAIQRNAFQFACTFKEFCREKDLYFQFFADYLLIDDVVIAPQWSIPSNCECWPQLFDAVRDVLKGPRTKFKRSVPLRDQMSPRLLSVFLMLA